MLLFSLILSLSGCAYYNYFYNAKKYYDEGEKSRKEGEKQDKTRSRKNLSAYEKCIESAGRVLEYYPDSRWEDDALLLLAKAFYRSELYRKAVGKVDELMGKYPQSELIHEGLMWKGMSLLRVSQPDSARLILSGLFASEADPDLLANAHFALGEYYEEKARWKLAVEQFREVLTLETKDKWIRGQAWIKIGQGLSETGDIEGAVELYEQILGEKPSRRERLEATLQRAINLRRVDRAPEALQSLKQLLKDAAYIKEFPRIELEVAHCLRELGEYDVMRDKLEKLVESTRKGELAAEAHYELGWLLWEKWRQLDSSLTTLKEVKKVERSSPFVVLADSLYAEIETLYKAWQWLGFLENQKSSIDSAIAGLREFYFTDTVFVDSLRLLSKARDEKSKKRNRSRSRKRSRYKKEEKKQEAEIDSTADSTGIAIDSTLLVLDSTALAALRLSRTEAMKIARFELAGFHMFKRRDYDSSAYYFSYLSEIDIGTEFWGRTMASLAYISKMKGDTAAHDSIYEVILKNISDKSFANRAKEILGYDIEDEKSDSLGLLYAQAEKEWLESNNPEKARDIYLRIVDGADSLSDIRARAMLSAAYLTRTRLRDDSLSGEYYADVVAEFGKTEYGKFARKYANSRKKGEPFKDDKLEDIDINRFDEQPEFFDELMDPNGFENSMQFDEIVTDDKVYSPEEVDELPKMKTSSHLMKNYLRSYYPEQAAGKMTKGLVELEYTVDKKGKIKDIELLSSDPEDEGFEEAALKVVKRIKYRAGLYHGRQVDVRLKQILSFEPEDEKK